MSALDPTPFPLLDRWWAEAHAAEPRVPDAAQLATVGADGAPGLRTVLLKSYGPDDGFVVYTNYQSTKARALDATGRAVLLLHWKTLERQVIVEGLAARVDAAESDAYHAVRPRGSQIGAWASDQSRPVASRAALLARFAEAEARFAGGPVPRPPHWGGYRIRPHRIELWQGHPDRLHDRLEWTRTDDGAWTARRLYP